MSDYLVFVLFAPMAAFGGVAVGERRLGEIRPARSALLGLLAAALGIERRAAARHAALEHGYGVAVRVDAPGRTFSDYHTTQVPHGRDYATRADELAARPLTTILSQRDYQTDSLFTIAVWARPAAPVALAALAAALRRPHFGLSVGRKCCPLGLPPGPVVLAADDVLTAMAARPVLEPERGVRQCLRASPSVLATDRDGMPSNVAARWTETRRDAIGDRAHWQFALRSELIIDLPGTS